MRILITCLVLAGLAPAQQNLETTYRMAGDSVVKAFEPQRAVLQTSSAVVYDGRREVGYGVVVSADGHILAKASEVVGVANPVVTVDRTRFDEVEVLGVDENWDVVLLKVDAGDLVPVVFAETSDVPHGTWLVANAATSRFQRRARVGILSAMARPILPEGGVVLGVTLSAEGDELVIEEVNEKSGAHEAGLRKGDVIVAVAGKPVALIEEIAEALKELKAGSRVDIIYRRDEEEQQAEVRLSPRGEMFDEMVSRNDMMSGAFSRRRSGFPKVIQHDILGDRRTVGGPLLDLDGRCVGMNIARANRAESFAIPVEELREIAARLIGQ